MMRYLLFAYTEPARGGAHDLVARDSDLRRMVGRGRALMLTPADYDRWHVLDTETGEIVANGNA